MPFRVTRLQLSEKMLNFDERIEKMVASIDSRYLIGPDSVFDVAQVQHYQGPELTPCMLCASSRRLVAS